MVSTFATSGSRRTYWRSYLLVALMSGALFVLLSYGNAFEQISTLTRDSMAWRIDELFCLFVTATFALIALLVVHERHLRDETAHRREAEWLAQTVSRYDSLTGIPNRTLFLEECGRTLDGARAADTRLAVLVIDIDAFQVVNEAQGHAGGDRVLSTVALLLRTLLRRQDTLARLGADAFALLAPVEDEDGDDLFRLAERVLKVVREGADEAGAPLDVTVSIGIAKFPRDGESETALLRHAETALAQAKAGGRNRYALYDSALDARRRTRLDTRSELSGALDRGEIIAHYQPLVDLSTGRPVGFEALARWRHPVRGLLGAPDFIPVAEDCGLVGRVLTAMLRRACEDTRHWPDGVSIAINLSPPQLLDPSLPGVVLNLLAQTGVPPRRIELEITETALLQDFGLARRTMSALREAGMRMSLDDFGTGFSSLRHLQELPIDKIKIDRSFTARLMEDAHCRKIVGSMLGLGATLGLATVAEGVETAEEAEWLRAHGCTLGQGYLFARPMAPAEAHRTIHAPLRVAVRSTA